MAKKLRPYQQKAIQECWQALKLNDEPVLLMASVGSGKSLMIANILLSMQKAEKRALCIVNNAELVRNNCETFRQQGGKASIYCAALDEKNTDGPIIFGTPKSILNGIINNEAISKIRFNLIVVDEAHAINYLNHSSCFMRILRHYKQEYPSMRLLGATGTNFRFKGTKIVGDSCLFKHQVGNITTEQLIENNYLVQPTFEIDPELMLDFSKVTIQQNGQFDKKELQDVIQKSSRLTELICKQLIHIMESQNRFGVFIFATTRKHADEIMTYVPRGTSALILGETPQDERTEILEKARRGDIKFIVNIAIISVGVDVPAYDTIAYLRPTESLVLLVQTMGRALRLSSSTNKTEALVLDYAGNIDRHSHWDNPILLKALEQTINKDKPLVIICPECQQMNTDSARRCVGKVNDKRCEYYFEFKECPNKECKTKNDISTRHCRLCRFEMVDPNKKLAMLNAKKHLIEVDVLKARYGISGTKRGFRVNCAYKYKNRDNSGIAYENYSPINDRAMHVFYGQFVKQHCDDAGRWYKHLHDVKKVEEMLTTINTPSKLLIAMGHDGAIIKKKLFQ